MLHIVEISIPDRPKFGAVYQIDEVMPSKMAFIDGICVNVLPDTCSRFKKENNVERTLQTGSVSVSLNNTDVVASSIKAACLAKSPRNSLTKNMLRFDARPVVGGSLMRIVYEESNFTPFVKANDPYFNDYFQSNETPTNGYTVKIYIHYSEKK